LDCTRTSRTEHTLKRECLPALGVAAPVGWAYAHVLVGLAHQSASDENAILATSVILYIGGEFAAELFVTRIRSRYGVGRHGCISVGRSPVKSVRVRWLRTLPRIRFDVTGRRQRASPVA